MSLLEARSGDSPTEAYSRRGRGARIPRLLEEERHGTASRSGVRRVYFLLAGTWGFVLGWGSLAVGLVLSGERPDLLRIGVAAITTLLLGLAMVGSSLLNSSYSEYRHHRKH